MPSVDVSIEPVGPIAAGAMQRFVAIVHNAPNSRVHWSLQEGDAGEIDGSGSYKAPMLAGRFHVTATSDADPTATATLAFDVSRVVITPDTPEVAVAQNASYAMHATTSFALVPGVTWSLQEGNAGGTIDPKTGLYTAPDAPGLYHVIATSLEDSSSTAVVRVSVPDAPIAITPFEPALAGGATRTFTASTADPSVEIRWSVEEPGGGSIDPSGVYTAPNATGVFHVVASDSEDWRTSARIPVMVGNVMPSILNQGGPVVKNPVFAAVTFNDDPMAASLEAFASAYGASNTWRAQTAEYGVGPASALAGVHVSETLPATMKDDDVKKWLATKLDGTHPEFGSPTEGTIYTLYVPRSTVVTTSFGSTCAPLGGYHSFLTLPNGMNVPYTIIGRCHGLNLDWTTQLTSHELVEAVTDPLVNSREAYAFSDDAHAIWGLMHPETGDMCEWDAISSFTNVKPNELGFQIQRTWSNAEAALGHEPCVPAMPGEVFYTAIPKLDESVTYTTQGQPFTTSGVHIANGKSRTIDVNLVSNGERGLWNVYAWDFGSGHLKMTFDREDGRSGDTVHLTIKVLSVDPDAGAEPFEVVSFDGDESHAYYGVVGN